MSLASEQGNITVLAADTTSCCSAMNAPDHWRLPCLSALPGIGLTPCHTACRSSISHSFALGPASLWEFVMTWTFCEWKHKKTTRNTSSGHTCGKNTRIPVKCSFFKGGLGETNGSAGDMHYATLRQHTFLSNERRPIPSNLTAIMSVAVQWQYSVQSKLNHKRTFSVHHNQ